MAINWMISGRYHFRGPKRLSQAADDCSGGKVYDNDPMSVTTKEMEMAT